MSVKFLVWGETGEYSDHSMWFVRVFDDQIDADSFAAALNEWCRERGLDEGNINKLTDEYVCWGDLGHPLDPDFRVDYTGTLYRATAVAAGFPVEPSGSEAK